MMSKLRYLLSRRREMSTGLTIFALMLVPLLGAALYAVVHDDPKPVVRATDGDPPAQQTKPQRELTQEEFLNLPGSAGVLDESGKPVEVEETPVPPLPKVQGVSVSGGEDWDNRSSAVRNAISFARELSQVDPANPEPAFKRMSAYTAQGALQTARSMVDPNSAGKGKRPTLQYLFLYEAPQTGAPQGKLVYSDKTWLTVEFAPDGRLLLIQL
jgi:hypothetical protein